MGSRIALRHHENQITRVEVHLADVNGPKGAADDIRCLMEAPTRASPADRRQPPGRQPRRRRRRRLGQAGPVARTHPRPAPRPQGTPNLDRRRSGDLARSNLPLGRTRFEDRIASSSQADDPTLVRRGPRNTSPKRKRVNSSCAFAPAGNHRRSIRSLALRARIGSGRHSMQVSQEASGRQPARRRRIIGPRTVCNAEVNRAKLDLCSFRVLYAAGARAA